MIPCHSSSLLAGHSLAVAGLLAAGLALHLVGKKYFKKRFYKLEVRDESGSRPVQYVTNWLESNGYLDNLDSLEVQLANSQKEEGNTDLCRSHMPALNVTELNVDGAKVLLKRSIYRDSYGDVYNTLELTVDMALKEFLNSMIEDARLAAQERPKDKLTVFRSEYQGIWIPFGPPRNPRTLESVILDKGVGESLLKDLERFISSKEWYAERRLPYRRGYLLYGPPGCGKSSIVKALASELGFAVCVLNLTHKKMTDEALIDLMCVVPNKSIVLLEDVDAIFGKKSSVDKCKIDDGDCGDCDDGDPRQGNTANTVTFSGLLNTIDGIAAADGRILFMTTNHLEKLDSALIRPGRVDRRQLVTYPSAFQLRQLFSLFYKDADPTLAEQFVNAYKAANLEKSVAEIQGHFLLFKDDPKKAIELIAVDYDPADY